MSTRKHRGEWIAGAFIAPAGGSQGSSLTGLSVSSLLATRDLNLTNAGSFASATVQSLTGAGGWRGIATINSGTTIASVAATAAVSGAVIIATIMQYTGDRTAPGTWGQIPTIAVQSVRAGAFELVCVGSYAPLQNMPVGWMVVR